MYGAACFGGVQCVHEYFKSRCRVICVVWCGVVWCDVMWCDVLWCCAARAITGCILRLQLSWLYVYGAACFGVQCAWSRHSGSECLSPAAEGLFVMWCALLRALSQVVELVWLGKMCSKHRCGGIWWHILLWRDFDASLDAICDLVTWKNVYQVPLWRDLMTQICGTFRCGVILMRLSMHFVIFFSK